MSLPDIQNTCPSIQIGLNRVGITDLKLPIKVLTKNDEYQTTIADISCYINLEPDKKGINMSRLPIVLHEYNGIPISGKLLNDICQDVKNISEAEEAQVIYKFPYFINKKSPVTNIDGLVHYNVTFDGDLLKDCYQFKFNVEVIATSLCPCSKEISLNNAHNQKCFINIECNMLPESWIWIEDIICIAEKSASCEIYSILKREDEKHVTERMYNNPGFVEDITRNIYEKMSILKGIRQFNISVSSDESIHIHKAYAKICSSLNSCV